MAMLLGPFVPDTAAQWRSVVKGEVARQAGIEGEAKKLAGRLERVAVAVREAEARAARGDDSAAWWLEKVRETAYKAEGAVDRCRVEARRLRCREQQRQALPRLLSSCCDSEIAAEVKNLNQNLHAILKEQRQLQLHAKHTIPPARTVLRHHKLLPPESDTVSARIEDDANRLLRRLTESDGQACKVVAIVGADGIGKTTLAKKVYGSERARRGFDTRSWVHVSSGHGEAGLLSQIIGSLNGYTAGAETVAHLEALLAGLVADRKFLLVLNDVWHGGVWEDVLRRPLMRGARGSKVLVTVRHTGIAREMGAAHIHRVRKLRADDGLWLLRTAARVAEEIMARNLNLKSIGERIVEKCGGVPLAIKAVAGVLRTREVDADEWMAVLRSPAWSVKGLPEDLMKALYVCYDDLPCHLKQCFLYCSLFPSGFVMDKRALAQKWIAEGFVEIREDSGVEAVAEEYYNELVGRNLLQPVETNEHGDIGRCTMHGMLRALAHVASQGEDLTETDAWRLADDASLAPRRVSLARMGLAGVPDGIGRLEGLRTLLLQSNPLAIQGDIFARLKHLRVLDLSETAIDVIPETLGHLVYLKFLNLSDTMIQAIPESIGNLWSLKFLLLRDCKSLHALPKGIEQLNCLRELDLAGTSIDDAVFRVGQLRSLTSLEFFAVESKEPRVAHDRSGWPLSELKSLCQLRTLHIQKLEKASSRSDATRAALGAKTWLRELVLSCSGTVGPLQTSTVARKIEEVFDELNPPQSLESLKLVNYFGTKFPKWLSPVFLPNLRRVDIVRCNFCQSIPPLGRFPELRSLCIADSSALEEFDAEFMGNDHQHQISFPKLEILHLQGMHKLEAWTDIEAAALPSLQAMQIESCPKLQCLPAGLRHATSLTEMHIVDAVSLEALEDLAALRELSVWNTPKLRKISNLPSLEDINISHCPALQTVENVDALRAVHIFDHELQEIPRWVELHALRLRFLDVTSTVQMLKRCLVDGLDWHMIRDIAQVHVYSNTSSYIHYTKSPYSFESNVSAQEDLIMEEKAIDSGRLDEVSTESRNVNRNDVSASASGTGYLEISGFFESDVVKTGATKTEGNVSVNGAGALRSMLTSTRRRAHKLAEAVPEDAEDEAEAGEDSVVMYPCDSTRIPAVVKNVPLVVNDDFSSSSNLIRRESRATADDETSHDLLASSVLARRRRSNRGGTSADHTLRRGQSQTISITETDQDFPSNLAQSKEHPSKKGNDSVVCSDTVKDTSKTLLLDTVTRSIGMANRFTATAADGIHIIERARNVSGDTEVGASTTATTEVKHGKGKSATVTDNNTRIVPQKTKKMSSAFVNGGIASAEAGTITAAIRSSDAFAQRRVDKVNKISTAAPAASTDADEMSQNSSGKEVTNRSAGAIGFRITETAQDLDSSLVHGKQQSPKEGNNAFSGADDVKYSSATPLLATAEANIADHRWDDDVSFTRGERRPQSVNDDRKILEMESKTSVTDTRKHTPELVKDAPAETAKNIANSESMRAQCHAIDITEPSKKAKNTMANKFLTNAAAQGGRNDNVASFSINVEADGSRQAPKVYTAIWGDTDSDTRRARFFSTMQNYRKMASRRRRRQNKHCSEDKWSLGPMLVTVLLIVSVVQLLLIFWLIQKLVNLK